MFYPRTTPDRWRMSVSEEAGPREAPPPEALVRGGEGRHSLEGLLLLVLRRTGSTPDSYTKACLWVSSPLLVSISPGVQL